MVPPLVSLVAPVRTIGRKFYFLWDMLSFQRSFIIEDSSGSYSIAASNYARNDVCCQSPARSLLHRYAWRPSEAEVPGLNCSLAVPHRFKRTKLSTRLTSIADIPLSQHTLTNQAPEWCAAQIPTNAYVCSTRPFNLYSAQVTNPASDGPFDQRPVASGILRFRGRNPEEEGRLRPGKTADQSSPRSTEYDRVSRASHGALNALRQTLEARKQHTKRSRQGAPTRPTYLAAVVLSSSSE